jgi:putative transposase
VRPHEALDRRTPAAGDAPSFRAMPTNLPPLAYPDRVAGRDVSPNGGMWWHRPWVNVSTTCAGEDVGLEDIADGVWNIDFGPLTLGRQLARPRRIEAWSGSLKRHR